MRGAGGDRPRSGWSLLAAVPVTGRQVAVGAVLLLVHQLAPGEVGRYLAYLGCAAVAAWLVHRGVGRFRPAHPAAWRLVELGLWCHAGYGVVGLGRATLLWPWWEQAETAVDGAGHVSVAAAAVMFVALRRPGADRDGLIDLATVLVAGGLLAWRVVAGGLLSGAAARPAPIAVALLMAAATVVGLRLHRHRAPSAVLLTLAAALVLALVGDVAEVAGGGEVSRAQEALWLTAALLVGAVARHPRMRVLSQAEPRVERQVSSVRLVGLGAALLVNPMLVVLPRPPVGEQAAWFAGGVGALTVLVLWRIGRLVTDRERVRHDLVEQIAQRDALAAALQHAATHDALTGLPNRAVLVRALQAQLSRPAVNAAVLFVDLDGFKPVNDQLGHAAGDELLVLVAGRLRSCLREGDVAARLGGDEFGLLVHGAPDLGDDRHDRDDSDDKHEVQDLAAPRVADRIRYALSQPFALSCGTVTIGASIGTAHVDGGPMTAEELLQRADAAMYEAKRAGSGHLPTSVRGGAAVRR